MLILNILVEHAAYALNRPFSYVYFGTQTVKTGMRAIIEFNHKQLVGYIMSVEESQSSKEELEQQRGFEIKEVSIILDQESLLTPELMLLSEEVASYYFAPLISVYQAMLPPSLKPMISSLNKAKIAYEAWIQVSNDDETGLTPKQCELLRFLKNNDETPKKEIKQQGIMKTLISKGLVNVVYKEKMRYRHEEFGSVNVPILTEEQKKVINEYEHTSDSIYLLEGVTGSGKTEVYLQLAKKTILEEKKVIILVPEIALTPLMMRRFYHDFSGQIAIFHSELSNGEKYDEYRRIARGEVSIVIGTRSAIFTPLDNLGLIIIDEEHVEAYKQDVTPCYHAKDVAIMRLKHFDNCKLLLGSATPSLESRARARKKVYHHLFLNKRINARELPVTEIINLQDHSNIDYHSSIFSLTLRHAIKETLSRSEQIVLLLNRRGYALTMLCRDCGHVIKCPDCEIALTYHAEDKMLKCHHCGHVAFAPNTCPECDSKYLTRLGFGVEKVAEEISRLFPQAQVLRLDADTGKVKNNIAKTLDKFRNHEADILLGTQMIAKGHDFKDVTLVGIVLADLGLALPSYRSSERTFQLITQAIGRSGRGEKIGKAFIQTYMPNHYAIKLGARQDYNAFFEEEMKIRKIQMCPPFTYLTNIVITAENETIADEIAMQMVMNLSEALKEVATIIGPTIPFINRVHDGVRRSIMLKYKNHDNIKESISEIVRLFAHKKGIKIRIDVDTLDV